MGFESAGAGMPKAQNAQEGEKKPDVFEEMAVARKKFKERKEGYADALTEAQTVEDIVGAVKAFAIRVPAGDKGRYIFGGSEPELGLSANIDYLIPDIQKVEKLFMEGGAKTLGEVNGSGNIINEELRQNLERVLVAQKAERGVGGA